MKNTLCWQCSKPYPMKAATCPHCGMVNANHAPDKAAEQAAEQAVMREETIYEKSARWAWPDGRPDL